MTRERSAYWFAALCLTSVVGCASEGVATEGGMLITVTVPFAPGGSFVSSIEFVVFCDATEEPPPVAEGQLETTGDAVMFMDSLSPVLLWQALVDGLAPGDCTVRLLARDDRGEIPCVATETVPIVAGEVAEATTPLICDGI